MNMKEKLGAYKWLMIAIGIVACDVGWNVYQNQSLQQSIVLKSESQNLIDYEPGEQTLQSQQDLSDAQEEKDIISQ